MQDLIETDLELGNLQCAVSDPETGHFAAATCTTMLAKSKSAQGNTLRARNNASDQVSAVLNPVRGYRDQLRRNGVEPVDHARRNLKMIKETQRRIKEEKEAAAQQAPPVPFKLKKFANVQSRVTQENQAQSPREEDSSPRTTHKFLRKGEGVPPKPSGNPAKAGASLASFPASGRPASGHSGETALTSRTRERLKDPVPKANELNKLAPRSNKNFIQNNSRDVLARNQANREKETARATQMKKTEAKQHANFGRVPTYLLKRQAEILQAEAQRAELAESGCPPGMVRMDDAERIRTLTALKQSAEDTHNDLRKLPLTISSMAQRKRKDDLEKQLEEQEAAIELFSRDKVFVYE